MSKNKTKLYKVSKNYADAYSPASMLFVTIVAMALTNKQREDTYSTLGNLVIPSIAMASLVATFYSVARDRTLVEATLANHDIELKHSIPGREYMDFISENYDKLMPSFLGFIFLYESTRKYAIDDFKELISLISFYVDENKTTYSISSLYGLAPWGVPHIDFNEQDVIQIKNSLANDEKYQKICIKYQRYDPLFKMAGSLSKAMKEVSESPPRQCEIVKEVIQKVGFLGRYTKYFENLSKQEGLVDKLVTFFKDTKQPDSKASEFFADKINKCVKLSGINIDTSFEELLKEYMLDTLYKNGRKPEVSSDATASMRDVIPLIIEAAEIEILESPTPNATEVKVEASNQLEEVNIQKVG